MDLTEIPGDLVRVLVMVVREACLWQESEHNGKKLAEVAHGSPFCRGAGASLAGNAGQG